MKESIFALALVVSGSASAATTIYDLKTDWSDVSNPNGAWSYLYEGVPLVSGTWVGDAWGQRAWVNPSGSFIPAAFQFDGSASAPPLDWVKGDIVQHTNYSGKTQFRWTAPGVGTADVTGAIWQVRNLGRILRWAVDVNGTEITAGTLDPSYTRSSSFDLQLGSSPGVLTDIPVVAGSTIDLVVWKVSTEEYSGQNFTVAFTPVPEPASLAAIGFGLLCVARRRRRG